jgi:hypothetical protein
MWLFYKRDRLIEVRRFYEMEMNVVKAEIMSLSRQSGFGGLEDACWPLVSKFADSNPA